MGQQQGIQEQPIPQAIGPLRVLIVDDSLSAREILGRMVQDCGFSADSAESGIAGLQRLETANEVGTPYDLILMDWQMPDMDGVVCAGEIQRRFAIPPLIIMVTAYGREHIRDDAEQDDIHIDDVLAKPVTVSSLLDAISTSLGYGAIKSSREQQSDEDYRHAVDTLRGARILLVEDNEVNQELATELLSAKGLLVEIAVNGQEALRMLWENRYDGVLMDCQMPVMDGYTATRKIREETRFANLPVIAMTANAMVSDVRKSLDAGMNDHIAKPLNLKEVLITMAQWITPSKPFPKAMDTADVPVDISKPDLPMLQHIDVKESLTRLGGDLAFYLDLLHRVADTQKGAVTDIREVLVANDRKQATLKTHTLKGVAANIGAQRLRQLAGKLEVDLDAGMEIEEEQLTVLEQELTVTMDEIGILFSPPAQPLRHSGGFDTESP